MRCTVAVIDQVIAGVKGFQAVTTQRQLTVQCPPAQLPKYKGCSTAQTSVLNPGTLPAWFLVGFSALEKPHVNQFSLY